MFIPDSRTLKKTGFQMPSIRQMRKWLQNLDIEPGISQPLLKLLKEQCQQMQDKDKDCVLMWDEISIKEYIQYDKNKDKLEGIVDYGYERSLSLG